MRGEEKGKQVHSFTVSTTANFRAYNIAYAQVYKRGRDKATKYYLIFIQCTHFQLRKMEGEERCMNFQLRKEGDCPYLDLEQLNSRAFQKFTVKFQSVASWKLLGR